MCPRTSTKIDIPELASYSSGKDMYDLLLREVFRLQHKNDKPLPENYQDVIVVAQYPDLRLVIPEYNGWWWNPYKNGQIIRKSGQTVRVDGQIIRLQVRGKPDRFKEALTWAKGEERNEASPRGKLRQLTESIIQVGQKRAIRNEAVPLFENAITIARKDYEEADHKFKAHSPVSASDFQQHTRLERMCRYQRLRLYWLNETFNHVHSLQPAAKEGEKSDVVNIDSLVKPSEIYCAENLLDRITWSAYAEGKTMEDRLAWWLSFTLFSCGAFPDEIKQMRNNKPWREKINQAMRHAYEYKEKLTQEEQERDKIEFEQRCC